MANTNLFSLMTSVVLLVWVIRVLKMFVSIPTPQKQKEEVGQIYNARFFICDGSAKERIEEYFRKIKYSQCRLAVEYFVIGILIIMVGYVSNDLSFLRGIVILLGFSGGSVMIIMMLVSSGEIKNNILGGLELGKLLDD